MDLLQHVEVPTEITFKMVAPRPSTPIQTLATEFSNVAVKVPRVASGQISKRYKPQKSSQPKRLLLKSRKPQPSFQVSKSDDECRHSDSLFSDLEDDESSSSGRRHKAPKALSLSLSDLTV